MILLPTHSSYRAKSLHLQSFARRSGSHGMRGGETEVLGNVRPVEAIIKGLGGYIQCPVSLVSVDIPDYLPVSPLLGCLS